MTTKIAQMVLFLSLSFCFTASHAYSTYGAKGCGSLISAVDNTSEKDKYSKDLNEMVVKTWLAGYISAYNSWLDAISKKNDSNVIASTDLDGVYMSVVNYCRANPLQNVSDAINDTLTQIQSQTKRKR